MTSLVSLLSGRLRGSLHVVAVQASGGNGPSLSPCQTVVKLTDPAVDSPLVLSTDVRLNHMTESEIRRIVDDASGRGK